ncbi:MAG: PorT family protein [Paludibacter sp.]|nr:PorT family protein [Bacteroidales bacterium]MCM1069184.1 PorT family protein [Prevotella sp.]MCM1354089.1 PorT family protein [Bacteroides sp.]MCM1442938.1 PorT family protein [Muribaculum sp.]MCM1481739.1 PorT family protein [Paludibacter sp.]
MKKCHITILLFCCLSCSALWGRNPHMGTSSAFDISIGGGWSTISYRPMAEDMANTGSWGLTAHVGYTFFFTPVFGLSVGADFARYGATLHLPEEYTWVGVFDTDGEIYDHHLHLNQWRERHNALYVEIPLALRFSVPLDNIRLTFDVGAKYGLALSGSTKATGIVSHTGWYDKWHLLLYDLPPYGFYSTSDFTPSANADFRDMWAAFLKVGVAVPIMAHLDFTCALSCTAGLTNNLPANLLQEDIGFRNDRPGMDEIHAFMPNYTNLLNTSLIGDKAHAFSVGLELGVSYRIPHRRHSVCRCWFD